MYTYEKKILFSDIDSSSRMSLSSILDAMQDCVNINSESIGKGIDYMHEKKRAWFAIGWNICIRRIPKMLETVVVKTWPYDFAATMGYRNVIITDESGEDIIAADSFWSLMDMNTGLPTRITDEDCEGYELSEKYPMEAVGRKIRLPKAANDSFSIMDSITVRKSDIDFNGHMTNGQYIRLADDFMPDDVLIKRIRVEYKSQSKLGETLLVKRLFDETENRYIMSINKKEDDSVRAVVEFLI